MPFTINGIGTRLYGARGFLPNGSYITTEWLVFFYLPVVPLRSQRILPSTAGGKHYALYSSSSYSVLEKTGLNWHQVLLVYSWFAVVIGSFWAAVETDSWWLAIPAVVALGGPWYLRKRAVKLMINEHERRIAGASPTTMD